MEIEISRLELRYARLRIADAVGLARLVASVQQHGQQSPVVVVPFGDGARYVLIDGYARVAALRSLARDMVEAMVLDVPESEALMLAHGLAGTRRRTALEEGWLIDELVAGHGLEQRGVARRLQRSASWVSLRLALVRVLPGSVQDAVRSGRVPPQAAMKHLVAFARAKSCDCERLVTALAPHAVTSRQVERLWRGWCRADDEGRTRIVTDPWLFLKADEAALPKPAVAPGDPVEPLLRDLDAVVGITRHARRRLREGVLARGAETSRRAAERLFEQSRLAFAGLAETFAEEVQRARSGHESGDSQAA